MNQGSVLPDSDTVKTKEILIADIEEKNACGSIEDFYEHPILNSPYTEPKCHWGLTKDGEPTKTINPFRRPADFITPLPTPKKKSAKKSHAVQQMLPLQGTGSDIGTAQEISVDGRQYSHDELKRTIRTIRNEVSAWRKKPERDWIVTAETAKLLKHWRTHAFHHIRPFFCQVEAVETLIWFTEVAPKTKVGRKLLERLNEINTNINDGLPRIALKLATGAGKTTVMAMVIAWQTVNAVRHPGSKWCTKNFLVTAPGITIRDRLRVLQPNDPDSYIGRLNSRELLPQDMIGDVMRAQIVITNYHTFHLRERLEISKGTRDFLTGGHDGILNATETVGEMLRRVMPEILRAERVMLLNDEAHHCYLPRQTDDSTDEYASLAKDDKAAAKAEAAESREHARLWFSGLQAIRNKVDVLRVVDLSATPFFIGGSGYAEGTIFPWVVSDFSLMDAIECGIVKLPRFPISDNTPTDSKGEYVPMYRELWANLRKIKAALPKKGTDADPEKLPPLLYSALESLYGHYAKVFETWASRGIQEPPCFIIVCANTALSKAVYDWVAGYVRPGTNGQQNKIEHGKLALFSNYDENLQPLPRPRTLLIDSKQLEASDALDPGFAVAAKDEIENFRREALQRGGKLAEELRSGGNLSDATLLREVMNTVGKPGRLGGSVRCVVSVSMLAEGWDANNVTHVLGVRAFGTQLLCEQVMGRALRRRSYDIDPDTGLFAVEYADVMGIPFDFASKPVVAKPTSEKTVFHVTAVSPERDALEITYPVVLGYRTALPSEHLEAQFTEDSEFALTPDMVGATVTDMGGIVGIEHEVNLDHLREIRDNTVVMHLTKYLLENKFRDDGGDPPLHLFGQLRRIAEQWFREYFHRMGGTYPAQILYRSIMDEVCERIRQAIYLRYGKSGLVKAIISPHRRTGSTAEVDFRTVRPVWETDEKRCHVNYAVLDSDWERLCCRMLEKHPNVRAYVRNDGLGFTVPYRLGNKVHEYVPDFIVRYDDGHGDDDLLNVVIEIKGYRGEDAKVKASTMRSQWVPGVNGLGEFGRWAFVELRNAHGLLDDFDQQVGKTVDDMFSNAVKEAGNGN